MEIRSAPDVSGIHLKWVDPDTVALRCTDHPELSVVFTSVRDVGGDSYFPLGEVVLNLQHHLPKHKVIPTARTSDAEGACLTWETARAAAFRCRAHPEVDQPYQFDDTGVLLMSWVTRMLRIHLSEHSETAPEEPVERFLSVAEPQIVIAEGVSVGFQQFTREVIAMARQAMIANEGDPLDHWPDVYRLAVAVVLLNLDYLRKEMGRRDGTAGQPGYSLDEAVELLLLHFRPRPQPRDFVMWQTFVRDHLRPATEPAGSGPGLWTPASTAGRAHG